MASIRITHTHAEGTRLTGSVKGDGVWPIAKAKGWTYRPVPGIFIRGSRDHHPQLWRIEQTAKALRDAGHTVTVELDDKARPTADVEAERAARIGDRQDALEDKAERLGGQAAGRLAAERAILDMIPAGQPVLVGHHSEGRHRRDLARADNHRRVGMELSERAEEAARKAKGSRAWQELRKSGPTTKRRIEGLEADRRKVERDMKPCPTSGRRAKEDVPDGRTFTCPRCYNEVTITDRQVPDHGRRVGPAWAAQRLAELDDKLSFWRAYLETLKEAGVFVEYGPDDFKVGGPILVRGRLCLVKKLNRKTVEVHTEVGMDLKYGYEDVAPYQPKPEQEGGEQDG